MNTLLTQLPALSPILSVSKSFFISTCIHARPAQTSKQATSSKNTSMDVHVEHTPEPLLEKQTKLLLHKQKCYVYKQVICLVKYTKYYVTHQCLICTVETLSPFDATLSLVHHHLQCHNIIQTTKISRLFKVYWRQAMFLKHDAPGWVIWSLSQDQGHMFIQQQNHYFSGDDKNGIFSFELDSYALVMKTFKTYYESFFM